jgi:exo-beta-1,3-glucanase (GH17 family)
MLHRLPSPLRLAVTLLAVESLVAGRSPFPPPKIDLAATAGAPSAQSALVKIHGFNFSPYIDGQDPNHGAVVSLAQVQARMALIAPYTVWVRSFGMTRGLEHIPPVARTHGLKVAAGAWIGRDLDKNNLEVASLIAAAVAGHVDIAIVGSEALLRGDVTAAQLIAYIQQVRQAVPAQVQVATADTFNVLLANPAVVAAGDVVFPNIYGYWMGVPLANAVCALETAYQQIVAMAGGRRVIISETGWPSAGNAVGGAVPSAQNAADYFLQFVSWAKANNVEYFYFQSLSEDWKAAYEGPQGAHWGVFDKDGVIKPGMQAVFDGQTVPVDCQGLPGGPGTPSLAFTYVPPMGTAHALRGLVQHASTTGHRIRHFIRVNGLWWMKPTLAQPEVSFLVDGTYSASIVTGGNDAVASDVAAFLLPTGYSVPDVLGLSSLPSQLFTDALAQAHVARTARSISGTVSNSFGHPTSGVLMTLTGANVGTAVTAPDGRYAFSNLPAAGEQTVTPSFPNYTFAPASLVLAQSATGQIANFVASPVAGPLDLSVTIAGSGTVTSAPSGIACASATCVGSFPTNSVVQLSASPSSGSVFGGWSGACSGSGACAVTLSAAQSVTATFLQMQRAQITSPAGTALGSADVTFQWSGGVGVTGYWLYVGSSAGTFDLFNEDMGTALSALVTGLPTDGRTIFVRLHSMIGGSWQFHDYTFTAAATAQRAQLTSPAPGSTLTSSGVTFQWTGGIGVTQYWLYVGTGQGAFDLVNRDVGIGLSTVVAGLPVDGRTLHVRLHSRIGGAWQFSDYTLTATTATAAMKAQLTSPAPGSTLAGSTVTLQWTGGVGASQYWLYIGNTPGTFDLVNRNMGSGLSTTVDALPTDGRTLYVRLHSMIGGIWQFNDYVLTATSTVSQKGELISPAPGSTLSSSTVVFQWTGGSGVSGFWLYVGTSVGNYDLVNADVGSALSTTASGLPTDGRPLYVRLHSMIAGSWQFNDYVVTAWTVTQLAELVSPAPGSTLVSSTVTLQWTGGTNVSQYWLYVGSSPATFDLVNRDMGTALSVTASGLPTDGRTIYVRLFSWVGSGWQFIDYTLTAANAVAAQRAQLTAPAPQSTLTGSAVTFQWTGGINVTGYWLYVGTSLGSFDLVNLDVGTNLSAAVTSLPSDGRTLYVRLHSMINGAWQFEDYQLTAHAAGGVQRAQLISPAPQSTLTASTVTFQWTGGTGVTQYWLYVGNSSGTFDLVNRNMATNQAVTVSGLPTDGRTLYVRLFSWIGSGWQFNDYTLTALTGVTQELDVPSLALRQLPRETLGGRPPRDTSRQPSPAIDAGCPCTPAQIAVPWSSSPTGPAYFESSPV